jgi:basic membrane protein A
VRAASLAASRIERVAGRTGSAEWATTEPAVSGAERGLSVQSRARPSIEEMILDTKTQSKTSDKRTKASGKRSRLTPIVVLAVGVAILALAAGYAFFASRWNPPSPTQNPNAGTSISTTTAQPGRTPIVRSITLVATIGTPGQSTPAGLTWLGIRAAAAQIGAATSLIEPATEGDVLSDLGKAAQAEGGVVVTVGETADEAVRAVALAYPATHFLELGVVVPDGAPANVHGLVFDEAEAGYLGGYVAASYAASGGVGMVGDLQTDVRSANYAAGFQNGARQANPGIVVAIGYAGSPELPEKGRAAAASLIKGGSKVVMAMSSLSGIGALRQACAQKALVVAVDTDAWFTVPDVGPCLVVSVMNRYDTAVTTALLALASGDTLPRLSMNDVANGGIALSSFHTDPPGGFEAQLQAVLDALRRSPPRATAAPPSGGPSASVNASAAAVSSSPSAQP